MAQFTVRIELHDAQWAEYEALHAEMERIGFTRQITGSDGRTVQLPWAEYNGSANLDRTAVRDIAWAAANTTGKKNSVLVTEASARAWSGLAPVGS